MCVEGHKRRKYVL